MSSAHEETLRLAEKPRPVSPGRLRLVAIGEGVFSTHALPESGTVVVGRSDEADIRVDERAISRRHAALHVGPVLRVEDLGSQNGTRVRDRKLEPNEAAEVAPGEVIELGSVVLIVQREAGAAAGSWDLATHERFVERLGAECGRGAPFAVARLQLSGSVGADSVQRVLSEVVRPSELAASYGPGEFELLLLGEAPEGAERRLDQAVHRLEALGARVRSGLACHPRDGAAPEPLLAACAAVKGPAGAPIVIRDDAMQQLHRLLERVAPSGINVLLLGETGVGKDVLAGELHRRSPRASKPFLRLNCAAISESLLESELFGHEKGSFTGAVRSKPGLLETAAGGTVLLDEIGELPASIQAKLLRVLEERQVLRVGGLKPEPIDVRFVFATNRDLEAEVARGAFRSDLYYRINGISLVIPPLRERLAELEPLARELVAQAASREGRARPPELTSEAVEALRRYPWPGNIRELRNVVERALLLCGDASIGVEHLTMGKPRPLAVAPPAVEARSVNLREERDAAERRTILDALDKCGGNQTRAAELLGVSRRTLVARIQSYGLTRPRKPKGT